MTSGTPASRRNPKSTVHGPDARRPGIHIAGERFSGILPGVYNPLIVLRLAEDGEPSLRPFADRVGCSHEMLNKFEQGEVMLGEENLAAYCRVTGKSEAEVLRRYHRVRLARAESERADARSHLKALGTTRRRGRILP